MKKLYRNTQNKMIAGVCSGVADYFSVDSTVVRLGVVVGTIITGFFPGVLLYLLAMFIIPEKTNIIQG